MPDPHPPAVVRGMPKAVRRSTIQTWILGGTVSVIGLGFMLTMLLLTVLGVSQLAKFPHPMVMLGVFLVLIVSVNAFSLARSRRVVRRITDDPSACLNCHYTLPPDTPLCHECGRRQNREDLSDQWRQHLAKHRRPREST